MVVFDMAGTTVNENNVVYKTLFAAIKAAGYPLSYELVLEQGAGKEKLQAIKDVVHIFNPRPDAAAIDQIFEDFKHRLNEAYQTLTVSPMPGAEAVFAYLKNEHIFVVLNTGYSETIAQLLLNKLGWQKGVQYDALITATQVAHSRPKPDMILLAQQLFVIESTAQIAKIGDSTVDIEEGINAGCGLNIGITTGAHTKEQLQLANPHYIINSLSDLPKLL